MEYLQKRFRPRGAGPSPIDYYPSPVVDEVTKWIGALKDKGGK